jgi:hypothetical protein
MRTRSRNSAVFATPLRENHDVTRVIAFDEAGNTGEDLLNNEQPVFTLASVWIETDVAEALAAYKGKELHFRSARKSHDGRAAILRVLTDPALSPETVRVTAIHKAFSVVAKMVDLLVEPLAASTGYDLYAGGAHIALSNLLFATLPVMLGDEAASRVFESFVVMCREPTKERRASFVLTLGEAARCADGRAEEHLKLLAAGTAVGAFGGSGIPDLDPAPPSLMALAHSWAADGESFAILHDDRPELLRWEPYLARFWPGSAEPETFILYDGRSLTYPLPVTGLAVAASHTDPRLQIADVVAGSLQFVLNAQLGIGSDPVFAATLRHETPLLSWLVDGIVWPSLDIDPEVLGVQPGATANLADAVTAWTARSE